jgi:hypothetical protein
MSHVSRSYSQFNHYIRHIKSAEERRAAGQIWTTWYSLITKEPLYRNSADLQDLMTSTLATAHLCRDVYEDASNEEAARFFQSFNQLWARPSIQKVFGVTIFNQDDARRFMNWLEEQKNQRPQNWSLKAPEKEEDFWKWYNDDKTGKPQPRE